MTDPVVITACDIYTAFGPGIDAAWEPLLAGQHAFVPCRRFGNPHFESMYGAFAPELDSVEDIPGFLLEHLAPVARTYPESAEVFLASTVGEIEQVENPADRCTSDSLLEKTLTLFEKKTGRVISAACASSNAAICRAEALLRNGMIEYAVIAAVDYISEFVFSGFASIKAMTETPVSCPYDKDRSGLLLGDAAGLLVLTRRSIAERDHQPVLAKITGCAMTSDARHITAPDPDGKNLADAIRTALRKAEQTPEQIGAVIGHGTGTLYNDSMEIRALEGLRSTPFPLVSVKGSSGHTLAVAGLIQAAMALRMFTEKKIPPQTGLHTPEPGGEAMLSTEVRTLEKPCILSMNSGFGGMNAVILMEAQE